MKGLKQVAAALGLFLLVLAAVTVAAPASAQSRKVATIEIRGNQRINKESILTVVSTKVGDEAFPERLERDRLAIEGLGWFQRVTQAIRLLPDGNVEVVFVVTEYPQVTQFQITGSTIFTEEQLRSRLKTKVGQIFSFADWRDDLTTIDKLYTDGGYRVALIYNIDRPEFLNSGQLQLQIIEIRVGAVRLKWPQHEVRDKEGNLLRMEDEHKTKTYVVMRELTLRQGALYNSNLLTRDYRALSGLGFFETITPIPEPGDNYTILLTWELTEKRTGQVSIGAGYSPRQQLIGRAELSDTNFQGKAQGVSVSAEIGTFGGDGLPSLELQFYEPWLNKDHTSLTVSLYDRLVYRFSQSLFTQTNFDSIYFERRKGGQVAFGGPFRWPVTLGLRFDAVETRDFPDPKLQFPRQDGYVISGNVLRAWNTRDYVNNPTEGYVFRLSTELGHAHLDKKATELFRNSIFNKDVADYRRYFRLRRIKATQEPEREQEAQKVPVIAVRGMGGAIVGDVPFYEQFFVGGAESLRGYLEDRFWGKYMFLGSVEYRQPLFSRIVGVLFADAGSAWGTESTFTFTQPGTNTRFTQNQGFRLFPSIGIGLRIATPIGPIRLDFGYGREGGRTHFSIGHTF